MKRRDVEIITGGIARDQRGQVRFVNGFDMSAVRRFYIIRNEDAEVVRGWRGHRIEQRWFYVLSGAFAIDLVRVDNWERASKGLPIRRECLAEDEHKLLWVPEGYGTAFQALKADSELLVFANFGIDNLENDNHTWPIDYFENRLKYEK